MAERAGARGSSSINGMIYIRGNRVDYDTWRDAYGCMGWGYADLLPYFLRAEDQQRGESPITAPEARCGWRTSAMSTR